MSEPMTADLAARLRHIHDEHELEDACEPAADRLEAQAAAIERVRAILADPPVPSRMLIPVIAEALDGEKEND